MLGPSWGRCTSGGSREAGCAAGLHVYGGVGQCWFTPFHDSYTCNFAGAIQWVQGGSCGAAWGRGMQTVVLLLRIHLDCSFQMEGVGAVVWRVWKHSPAPWPF
jgi:hypothetical protein